eukprot:7057716-Pyramimonas_sp.AAC.1
MASVGLTFPTTAKQTLRRLLAPRAEKAGDIVPRLLQPPTGPLAPCRHHHVQRPVAGAVVIPEPAQLPGHLVRVRPVAQVTAVLMPRSHTP